MSNNIDKHPKSGDLLTTKVPSSSAVMPKNKKISPVIASRSDLQNNIQIAMSNIISKGSTQHISK